METKKGENIANRKYVGSHLKSGSVGDEKQDIFMVPNHKWKDANIGG